MQHTTKTNNITKHCVILNITLLLISVKLIYFILNMRMTNVSGKWNEINRGDHQEMATSVLAV